MAQPDTLDRRMTSIRDRLVLTCRSAACGWTFFATRDQAIRRYGANATAYEVEQRSKCPACGGGQVDAALAATDRIPVPDRDRINYAHVRGLGLTLHAQCEACRIVLSPDRPPIGRFTPLERLFGTGAIRCGRCRQPVCGLSVDRRVANGGSMRETVREWWRPGSQADPAVREYHARRRAALGRV